ncbi:MAG: HD domain-containing protein [Candidatus Omnitrophota bacterium]|jgi:putative nucleotidyltransferase with HDIG domain/PAS domain S-box-containing protein
MRKKKKIHKKKFAAWELFFNKMLKKALLPVVVTDRKGRIIFVNNSYREHFGLPGKTLIGKNWIDDFMPDYEHPSARKIFNDIKKEGTSCFKFNADLRIGKRKVRSLQWLGILLEKDDEFFLTSIGKPAESPRAKKTKKCVVTTKAKATYAEAIAMIFVISKIIDPDIAEHSVRVTSLAVNLAKKIGMKRKAIERLKIASYLHDIGKLAISDKILNKHGPLTAKEFEKIKTHPLKGVEMIRPLYFLRDIVAIIQSHHENYDGTGYPHGKKGKNIPVEARVLSIADVYEALTSDRPYRKAFSKKQAIAIIEEEKGRKFDPDLTDSFLDMIKTKKIKQEKI